MYCYQDQANFEIALHFAQIDNKIIRLNIVSTLPNINELRDRSSCLYPSQTLMNYAIDRLDRPESKKERNCSPTERAYSDLRLGETVHAVIHFFNNLGTAILNSDFSIIPEQLGDLAQSLDFLAFTLLPLHIISSYLSTGEFFSPFHHTSGVCAVILSKFNKAEISADLKILLLSMRQTQQRMEENHAKFLTNPPLPPPLTPSIVLNTVANVTFKPHPPTPPPKTVVVLFFLLLKLCYLNETFLPQSFRIATELSVWFDLNRKYKSTLVAGHKSHLAYFELIAGLLIDVPSKERYRGIKGTDPNYWKMGRYLNQQQYKQQQQQQQPLRKLYIVGDSHSLSLAWRNLDWGGDVGGRRIVPAVCTGIKAFHLTTECRPFFTKTNFDQQIRLHCCRGQSGAKTIVVCAGEIDTREGMVREGRSDIRGTVENFVSGLKTLLNLEDNSIEQILVMPVCCHAKRPKKGRVIGREARRVTVGIWNACLREVLEGGEEIGGEGIYFLDYFDALADKEEEGEGILLKELSCGDGTHMNGGFEDFFVRAVRESGCNMEIL